MCTRRSARPPPRPGRSGDRRLAWAINLHLSFAIGVPRRGPRGRCDSSLKTREREICRRSGLTLSVRGFASGKILRGSTGRRVQFDPAHSSQSRGQLGSGAERARARSRGAGVSRRRPGAAVLLLLGFALRIGPGVEGQTQELRRSRARARSDGPTIRRCRWVRRGSAWRARHHGARQRFRARPCRRWRSSGSCCCRACGARPSSCSSRASAGGC